MDLIIKANVLNPALVGKAVRIKGFDIDGEHWDRLFLVKNISVEYMDLINCQGTEITNLHIENFEHADASLKLTVLEESDNE